MIPAVLHIDIERTWRGGQKQAVSLYEYLLGKGIKSDFICRKESKLKNYFLQNKLPYKEYSIKTPLSIANSYRIAKYAKANNFNIIQCHSSASLTLGMLAKIFYPKLVVIGTRRVAFKIKSRWKYNSSLVKKIVCISNGVKQSLIDSKIKEEKLTTIYSGIKIQKADYYPLEIAEYPFLKNKFVVGTIASLSKEKDYHTLIEAAKIVTEKHNNIIFIALGTGELEEEIKDKIEKEELINKFHLLGFKEDVYNYLNRMDLYVTSTKNEGLGSSILDAMSFGKPIVATNTGGIPEIVKHNENGILVPVKDKNKLAEALIYLIENKEIMSKFGIQSKLIAQRFDINNTNKQYVELYNALL